MKTITKYLTLPLFVLLSSCANHVGHNIEEIVTHNSKEQAYYCSQLILGSFDSSECRCGLQMMLVRNENEQQNIINKFYSEFSSRVNECNILIVHSENTPDEWTIARVNVAGQYKTKKINKQSTEKSTALLIKELKELKEESPNNHRIIMYVTTAFDSVNNTQNSYQQKQFKKQLKKQNQSYEQILKDRNAKILEEQYMQERKYLDGKASEYTACSSKKN